jgi:hypothetical protein
MSAEGLCGAGPGGAQLTPFQRASNVGLVGGLSYFLTPAGQQQGQNRDEKDSAL